MQLSYKNFIILAILPTIFVVFGFVLLMYLYDPLQFFHKPYFRPTTFSTDMWLQNVGIIKHYDFDSYIIGDSMVEHLPINRLDSATNEKWVNLMMYGATLNDRAVILDYLFKHKSPKEIIYALDFKAFETEKTKSDTRFYAPAYSDNFGELFQYYSDSKYFKCAITWSLEPKCVGVAKPLDMLNRSLIELEFLAKKFGGFEKWVAFEDARIKPIMDELRAIKKARNSIESKLQDSKKVIESKTRF
ncbi:hypothetical protein DCO58_05410 [Helicobacter saguini]|uniref:Uncharacterized protein n=1 Tax=Helicobacter saguini TaxID=1548018 RepID=A0A347VT73_9HELI|nr:hypothetical protein [Helicobacter saguini]MWV62213.1 hypothetical protein [Helicobacter saguini]MWV67114.1 hypothetical protein [Helicobacter saguini]MWV69464.1 hypothetical protein [Helicobacter saguini]MWV70983.1 hypothetical protein [Helicobacter saguini]TLD92933.1 hypothetical protein LS64_009590 [Helicobacter saguini]